MVYLAGPMRGRTDGFPEFYQAAEHLRLAGFEVFNPPEKSVYTAVGIDSPY